MVVQVILRNTIEDTQKYMREIVRQVPYAQQKALNDVAFLSRERLVKASQQKLDNPVPFIAKSWRVIRAKDRRRLQAFVEVKDPRRQQYYETAIIGGEGVTRALTNRLHAEGLLPRNLRLVPAPSLTRNRYGNISRSKWNSIAARIGDGRVFVGKPRGGNRQWGIWQRVGGSTRASRKIVPLFLAVDAKDARPNQLNPKRDSGSITKPYQDRFNFHYQNNLRIARERIRSRRFG